jgi:thiosulfate/3-mercaptopyruvate sulfurtransferase
VPPPDARRPASASPLISPEELFRGLGRPGLRIVDVRWYLDRPGGGRESYQAGHIPEAIFLDLDADLSAPEGAGRHPLPDPIVFAGRLGAAGIASDDLVVAYDDVGGWVAARLWWMLDDLGHGRVAVLDGGLPAWTAAGFPLTTEIPAWPVARLDLAARWTRIVDRDQLRERLGRVVLLDARGAPRYEGETEPVDPVAGHIPSAVNRPTAENLDLDGRFLRPDLLAAGFRALGIGDREVVTSCGSGVSACHHSLAMRAAGLPDPILYPGSWSDWGGAGYPIATGPEPGEPPLGPRDEAARPAGTA